MYARTLQVLGIFLVDKGSQVTTIVEDHVEGLPAGESSERLLNAPDVLLLSLSLPGEDGDAGGSDGSGGVVLGGEDVLSWIDYFDGQLDGI